MRHVLSKIKYLHMRSQYNKSDKLATGSGMSALLNPHSQQGGFVQLDCI
jgi:hypothetical protein